MEKLQDSSTIHAMFCRPGKSNSESFAMRPAAAATLLLISLLSCKKDNATTGCFPGSPTERVILNKKALVKLTATAVEPVYLVEEGAIDTRLIPCNFPPGFYENNLQVTISGEVKRTAQTGQVACCADNFVISKISR